MGAGSVVSGGKAKSRVEHKAEAGVASLSDKQVIEQAPVIFETLMAAYVEAGYKGDQAMRDQLPWFMRACDEEFDEAYQPPPRPLMN